jgi:hypothetical protein
MNGASRVRRWSLPPLTVVAGWAAFRISYWMLPPEHHTWSFGDDFAKMSLAPFAGEGPFPHRILGPLLAHVLGLAGERYWMFSHAVLVTFLACVFGTARHRGCSHAGAMMLTLVISITGAVEVFKGYVGYTEPLSFVVLLASAALVRRTGWFWALQFVGLLNHENLLFFWPWLLDRKAREGGGLRRGDWIGAGIVLAAYGLERSLLTTGIHSVGFYLGDQKLSFIAGAWILAVLAIVVYFGVLPLLLAWHAWFAGWRQAGRGIVLAVAAFFGMTFFANDLQRFVGFLAIPLVFAGIHMLRQPRGVLVVAVLGAITAVVILLQRGVVRLLFDELVQHPPDPISAIPTEVVPQLWYVFLGYAVAHVAMLVGGWRWARRGRAAAGTLAPAVPPAREVI